MKLHIQSDSGVTLIENTFIDQYMPGANGEFVKLFLYLLRCAGSGRDLSIASIADFFDHTEGDVRRALAYWEKLNLLRLTCDRNGEISDLTFLPADQAADPESVNETTSALTSNTAAAPKAAAPQAVPTFTGSVPVRSSGILSIPEKAPMSAARRQELSAQKEVRQMMFVAEQYIGRPLTNTESSTLLYFYDTLHFSEDLIEYLLEYCAQKGNPGARYMEKVATAWYQDGISSVADAKRVSSMYSRDYYTIFKAMGIKNRNPAPTETDMMSRWLNDYGFSVEIVTEACSRTIMQTHQPSFTYADGILKSWKEEGVHILDDIRQLDARHAQKKAAEAAAARNTDSQKSAQSAAKRNRFNNFPQRDYDWSALEQQLLGTSSVKGD